MTRTLAYYAIRGFIGAAVLWALASLMVFALSPEMGTP